MRDRLYRRVHAKRVQKKRIKKWAKSGSGWIIDKEKHKGMMKKTHFGCGCYICKPWKHGAEDKMKPSDRKKIDE